MVCFGFALAFYTYTTSQILKLLVTAKNFFIFLKNIFESQSDDKEKAKALPKQLKKKASGQSEIAQGKRGGRSGRRDRAGQTWKAAGEESEACSVFLFFTDGL